VITIAAILITWYLTKVYYTKSLRLRIEGVDTDKLVRAKCSKCARNTFVVRDNLRTPFYCSMCK
jgi:hypothetical protein